MLLLFLMIKKNRQKKVVYDYPCDKQSKKNKKCTLPTFASHQTQSLVPVVRRFAALKDVLSKPTTKHNNEKPLKSFSPAFRLNAPQGAYSFFFLLRLALSNWLLCGGLTKGMKKLLI
jgi:hypothetical protein